MCVKEFLGFTCGHCSVPHLRQCPLTSSQPVFPPCQFPAERPIFANEFCPPCARIVWNIKILQEEAVHRGQHERRECYCDTIFTDEERRERFEPQRGAGSSAGGYGNSRFNHRNRPGKSKGKANREAGTAGKFNRFAYSNGGGEVSNAPGRIPSGTTSSGFLSGGQGQAQGDTVVGYGQGVYAQQAQSEVQQAYVNSYTTPSVTSPYTPPAATGYSNNQHTSPSASGYGHNPYTPPSVSGYGTNPYTPPSASTYGNTVRQANAEQTTFTYNFNLGTGVGAFETPAGMNTVHLTQGEGHSGNSDGYISYEDLAYHQSQLGQPSAGMQWHTTADNTQIDVSISALVLNNATYQEMAANQAVNPQQYTSLSAPATSTHALGSVNSSSTIVNEGHANFRGSYVRSTSAIVRNNDNKKNQDMESVKEEVEKEGDIDETDDDRNTVQEVTAPLVATSSPAAATIN